MNCAVMFSVTSIVPSALIRICASKCWMTSWRAAATPAANKPSRPMRNARRRIFMAASLLIRAAEADLGNFPLGRRADLEELAGFEIEHVGDDIGRELRDLRVEIADHRVVVAPCVLDAVFDLVQRLLELIEALDGPQLRIGLRE